ncbi:hypothetical protein HYC85_013809 [Camellia sinensis]|uniref:PRONE domain-containing protein n=1 Tax=Camellia sinensis TaxID=4442 RepID=A0A7J7H4E2_CAMSI|nr:hypothetical protein HYC85_013809 [Camellia sinensis]
MESSAEKSKRKDGFESFAGNGDGTGSLTNWASDCRDSTTSSSRSSSETSTRKPEAKVCPSPARLGWPIRKADLSKCSISDVSEGEHKPYLDDSKLKKLEINMMKERFSKLLLGEDMSGNGKGVSTALAISNAITNLCATAFGQLWRLEPLPSEKKSMWRREMECLLCVSDHIIEFAPSWQTFPDGSKLEVMTCKPRSDLSINLPALCKLDDILIEILDSFSKTEFWYVDQGIIAKDADESASFCKPIQRQEEKWWLPVPRISLGGLHEDTRKQLHHKQMGEDCLGEVIYRYITSDQFSSECLLDCLDLSTEHVALEIANRVEASIYVWRRRIHSKPITNSTRSSAISSWDIVKELMVDGDKQELLAGRAENLLSCLKQRFPGLTQTTLDTSKIQCNKDVGKSILESYSRVLESLAFNIMARIDDLLYVDDLTRHSDELSSVPTVSVIAHKRVSIPYSVPVSGTPYKTAFGTPNFSPAPLVDSPARGERTPFLSDNSNKPPRRGFGVKGVLTNYLGSEPKMKNWGNPTGGSGTVPHKNDELPASQTGTGGSER